MKKVLATIIALISFSGIAYATAGIPISVPSAPGSGYVLISTSTGAYVATSSSAIPGNGCTSTNPCTATYFVATGTPASIFPNASTTNLSASGTITSITAGKLGTINSNYTSAIDGSSPNWRFNAVNQGLLFEGFSNGASFSPYPVSFVAHGSNLDGNGVNFVTDPGKNVRYSIGSGGKWSMGSGADFGIDKPNCNNCGIVYTSSNGYFGINQPFPTSPFHVMSAGGLTGNGTISDDGSGSISGSGTNFTTQLHVGDSITSNDSGETVIVFQIFSDTSMQVSSPSGANGGGFTYVPSQFKLASSDGNDSDLTAYSGPLMSPNNHNNWNGTIFTAANGSDEIGFRTTGDQYGGAGVGMYILNQDAMNGALFKNYNQNLVDFVLQDAGTDQANIRLEGRFRTWPQSVGNPEMELGNEAAPNGPTLFISTDNSYKSNFAGKVGIIQPNPVYGVDVNSSATIGSSTSSADIGDSTTANWVVYNNGLAYFKGPMGIGSTTPIDSLSVKGVSTANPFLVSSSSNARMFEISNTGATLFNNLAGTSGQVLQSKGSTASPSWVSTSTLGLGAKGFLNDIQTTDGAGNITASAATADSNGNISASDFTSCSLAGFCAPKVEFKTYSSSTSVFSQFSLRKNPNAALISSIQGLGSLSYVGDTSVGGFPTPLNYVRVIGYATGTNSSNLGGQLQVEVEQGDPVSQGLHRVMLTTDNTGTKLVSTTTSDGLVVNNNSGFGTTTPDSVVDVNGSFRMEGGSSVVTASISGAIIGIGCDSADTTVDASVSSTTAFVTTPQTYPGDGLNWFSYYIGGGRIRTKVCSDVTITPTASVYTVKILK